MSMPNTVTIPIRRALISVFDKTELVDFASFLARCGVYLLSTKGTTKILRDAGISTVDTTEYTGFPEILGGRVKTLHPKIHAGLLSMRGNAEHEVDMLAYNIDYIDLLIVNLYPFERTVADGARLETCIEMIDIGGVTMIRAAAKNYANVTVVVESKDYSIIVDAMRNHNGGIPVELRSRLATSAYSYTAAYDTSIARWLSYLSGGEIFPSRVTITGTLKQSLRYGENPHQRGAFYVTDVTKPSLATAKQLQGKELSYNNLCDINSAIRLAANLTEPAATIIKHTNPCGCAVRANLRDAYLHALSCDRVSAFGGVVAFNRCLDAETAAEIVKIFTEVVVAPSVTAEACQILAEKKDIRLLSVGHMLDSYDESTTLQSVYGGFLLQTCDADYVDAGEWEVVTKRSPTKQELDDLLFGWVVCKHVKSNAIVVVHNMATVGVGAGQMSRIDSVRIATWKAAQIGYSRYSTSQTTIGQPLASLAVASDAFFPFSDGLTVAYEAGVTAVIQPGGSIRDKEVIKAADERDMTMIFTRKRHFRH